MDDRNSVPALTREIFENKPGSGSVIFENYKPSPTKYDGIPCLAWLSAAKKASAEEKGLTQVIYTLFTLYVDTFDYKMSARNLIYFVLRLS